MSKILTGAALQQWFETAHAYLIDFDEKDWPTELNKYASGITLIPDSIDSLIQGCQFYLSFNEFNTCLSWIASFPNILKQNQKVESNRTQDCVKFLDLYTQFKQLIHRW